MMKSRKLSGARFALCDRRHVAFAMAVLTLLAAFVGACGGGARGARPASRAVEPERAILEVDNQSFTDMNIFIVNGGQRIRLGRAIAHQKAEFTISPTILSFGRELQFLSEPITRRGGALSNRIWVEPGERVMLLIPPG